MKKFSQLSEAKLEIDTNSVNYLTVNELKKYVNKMEDEFYSNVVIDYTDKIYVNTKQATLKIIDYLIKHNKTYVAELGGSNNKENALASFYQRSLPSDPEKKELYQQINILNAAMRLKEVPTFMTREEFNDVMNDKCSLDYVVYDVNTEKGRNKLAKQYTGLVYSMAKKYKKHANVDWNEWVGAAHLGLTIAMNKYSELKGIISKNNEFNITTVKYDDELKSEVKNSIKKKDKYTVKFVVFAQWCINFKMLDTQEDSHLVRQPKSAQQRERATSGKNTWNNTVSVNKKINVDNDNIDDTVPSIIGTNKNATIGDNISTNDENNELNTNDKKNIFNNLYKYLKNNLNKKTIAVLFSHFGLNGLQKIRNTDLSEYISNCTDEDINKLYDAIFNGDVNAEKQWIKDYKDGKFKKRKDNVKGATKAALSMNLKNAITFIRANKTAVNMLKELYYEN